MASLIKLKQIEGGTALGGASHSPASITSSAAPFSFDVGTQTGNIPLSPTVTVTGNSLTFNAGNGTPAVTFIPEITLDAFVQSGTYDPVSQSIILQLSNDSIVIIPVADLVPIAAVSTNSVVLTGNGTNSTPLNATVLLAPGPNALVSTPAGLSVAPTVVSVSTATSTSANITGDGTSASPLTANVLLAPGANALVSTPAGLSVAPAAALVFTQSESIEVTGDGTAAVPYQARIKLQPDVDGLLYQLPVLNLLHNPGALQEDTPGQKGLGYAIDAIEFNGGAAPFDITAVLTKYAGLWNGVPEIAKVDGYVNGVLYSDQGVGGAWTYTALNAVQWDNGGFLLDANDNVRFVVHVRAT